MCNLYRVASSAVEVARWFGVTDRTAGTNRGAEVYPGYTGLVVVGGELKAMNWGFPLAMKSKKTGAQLKPKPVNNARTDKLETGFWRNSFENRRCLIPVSTFAEAEGEPGRMTRTWISLPDAELFACAGIWRWSDEWSDVYSMVMTDPCELTACVHDRMPVVLRPDQYEQWQTGTPEEALSLCVPYAGLVAIDRTLDPWRELRSRTS